MQCHRAAMCCFSRLRRFETLQNVPLLILLHGVYGCQWNWWLNGAIDRTMLEMLRGGTTVPMMIAMPSDGLLGRWQRICSP